MYQRTITYYLKKMHNAYTFILIYKLGINSNQKLVRHYYFN